MEEGEKMTSKFSEVSTEKMEKAQGIFEMIGQSLDAIQIKNYKLEPDKLSAAFEINLSKGFENYVVIRINPDLQILILKSFFRFKVDPERFGPFSEAIARANDGLLVGRFSLDFSDGVPEFDVIYPYFDGMIGSETIPQLIMITLNMVDKYIARLLAVSEGLIEPDKIS